MNKLQRDTLKLGHAPLCPDCREYPATHCQANEYWCDVCDAYVKNIHKVLALNIAERHLAQSKAKDTRRRNWKAWYHKNKERINAYRRAYNALYAKGMSGQAQQDAMPLRAA